MSYIAILDFGSQYTLLILRRLRELGVDARVYRGDIVPSELEDGVCGIILSGGPGSVYEKDALLPAREVFELGVPVLGICYGMQAIAYMFGGKVEPVGEKEFGLAELTQISESELFEGLPLQFNVWMSHGDEVTKLPEGFEIVGRTESVKIAAMQDAKRRIFGLQFHPEVVHTPAGGKILSNFAYRICGAEANWSIDDFIEKSISEIRERVKEGKVICGISGGVDSTTVALLVHKAVGDRLVSIFVDNGLLRKGEKERVLENLRELGINVVFVDASQRFIDALAGVVSPEEKRKVIGRIFIDVFEEAARRVKGAKYLLQGTLYPDVIESGAGGFKAHRIKSHHNVGGLPERIGLEIIEPFRYLFKDEVRKVATKLGLPDEIVNRHPFPGPGLAVRIIGEVTGEKIKTLREADSIVVDEVRKAGLYNSVWQAFAVLLPVQTVGVKGDRRSYENVVAIRIVDSKDGMTADWVRLPYKVLERISTRILNEVREVNRVVYDISTKPPATIEWE